MNVPQSQPTGSPVPATRSADHGVPILSALWVIMLVVIVWHQASSVGRQEPLVESAVIDANQAPWWDLTALPRVGISIAREIIRYRKAATAVTTSDIPPPAFTCAADLTRVRGIGPKTVRRISPFLVFHDHTP